MPRKNEHEMPHICACCEHAQPLNDKEKMLCSDKGIVSAEYICKKFTYDPLKRNPIPLPELTGLCEEDLI